MKKILFILIGIITINTLCAQQTAEFETTIYVMDLNGNMDSVIVGYDSTASAYDIDPQFGEIDITNQLWDSILEVRVSPWFFKDSKLGKKQIMKSYCSPDYLFSRGAGVVTLSIRSHTPVVIFWNIQDFQDDCRDSSIIVDDDVFFTNPFLNYYQESYMAKRPNHGSTFDLPGYNYSYYQGNIAGGGTDTIFNVFIGFIDDINTNTNEQKQIQQQTKVFPNPTTEQFTIQLPENYYSENVQVFDITGREVYQSTGKSNQINVSSVDWAKGIYFYRVRLEDGILVSGKVVKD
jgi:protein gp37